MLLDSGESQTLMMGESVSERSSPGSCLTSVAGEGGDMLEPPVNPLGLELGNIVFSTSNDNILYLFNVFCYQSKFNSITHKKCVSIMYTSNLTHYVIT